MVQTKESTYDRILNATKDIIRQQGVDAVTVRQVSRQAQVNCALVNYHFHSKDNLLAIAVAQILSVVNDLFTLLDENAAEDLSPRQRLRRFLIAYVQTAQCYREVIQYHFVANHLFNNENCPHTCVFQQSTLEKLTAIVSQLTTHTNPQTIRLLALQLMCAVVMPEFITQRLGNYTLPSIESQVDLLMDQMFQRTGGY